MFQKHGYIRGISALSHVCIRALEETNETWIQVRGFASTSHRNGSKSVRTTKPPGFTTAQLLIELLSRAKDTNYQSYFFPSVNWLKSASRGWFPCLANLPFNSLKLFGVWVWHQIPIDWCDAFEYKRPIDKNFCWSDEILLPFLRIIPSILPWILLSLRSFSSSVSLS